MRKSKLMKALLVFGMSVVTATSMVGIAACNNNPGDGGDDNGNGNGHRHSYDGWNTSSTQHWHECLECSEEADRGDHKDLKNNKTGADGKDNYCDDCGYELAHTYATDWSKDASGHWHAAICEHTTEIDKLIPHVDEDKDNTCDVCGYEGAVADGYKALAEKAGATTVIADTFFAQDTKIDTAFTSFGTKGMYARPEKDTATVATNYIQVSGGSAVHVTNGTINTGLVVDFGSTLTSGIVEGYAEITPSDAGTDWSIIKFLSGNNCDDANRAFSLHVDSKKNYGYSLNTKAPILPAKDNIGQIANTLYKVYYKFDLDNDRVTMKVNDLVIVENEQLGVTAIAGYEIISSNGGKRLVTIDNLITISYDSSVADYNNIVLADIAADELMLPESLRNGEAHTTALSTLENATDKQACTTAYSTYSTAVITAYKSHISDEIANNPKKYTTVGQNKEPYDEAKTTLESVISSATKLQEVVAAYSTFNTTISALNDDEFYKQDQVTFTLDTIVSGAASGNTKTKIAFASEEITKAVLDKALGLPVNQKVVAWYTSATVQDESTLVAFTKDVEGTAVALKASEFTTTTLYAVTDKAAYSIDGTMISGTASEDTPIGEYFVITNKVKSESNKVTNSGYAKQISLTGGGAKSTQNSIKFVVAEGATATVKVVAARRADTSTKSYSSMLTVLNASDAAVSIADLQIDNVAASAFDELSDTTLKTYTFTLPAGTYFIGGIKANDAASPGAYIFELNVTLDVAA